MLFQIRICFFLFHSFRIETPDIMHLQIKMKRASMYLEGDLGGSGPKNDVYEILTA